MYKGRFVLTKILFGPQEETRLETYGLVLLWRTLGHDNFRPKGPVYFFFRRSLTGNSPLLSKVVVGTRPKIFILGLKKVDPPTQVSRTVVGLLVGSPSRPVSWSSPGHKSP